MKVKYLICEDFKPPSVWAHFYSLLPNAVTSNHWDCAMVRPLRGWMSRTTKWQKSSRLSWIQERLAVWSCESPANCYDEWSRVARHAMDITELSESARIPTVSACWKPVGMSVDVSFDLMQQYTGLRNSWVFTTYRPSTCVVLEHFSAC